LPELITDVWNLLGKYANHLAALAAILTFIEYFFAPFRKWRESRKPPQQVQLTNPELLQPKPIAPPPNTIQLDVDTFQTLQTKMRDEARADLAKAHGEDRAHLEQKIEALNARLADPDRALAELQAIITNLEGQLNRQGNQIGGDALAEAKAALESGDFAAARTLFETLSARTALEVKTHADAEFALGQIAEAEVRWLDAARHYSKAARLEPSFIHLRSASDYSERAGDYKTAAIFGENLLDLARKSKTPPRVSEALNGHALNLLRLEHYAEAETLLRESLEIALNIYGKEHIVYANRLNNLSELMYLQGQYTEAEELLRKSLEISRAAIGEEDAAFATQLSNLARNLQPQKRHLEAEALLLEALRIDRATIGEAHPSYGTHLNNLASVIKAQGRYSEAEDSWRQALAIFRHSLGDTHPNTKDVARNYLTLLQTHNPTSPDIPLLISLTTAPPVKP
jgi:tetratricopeptide (TPR) repeat protein